ncbi:hypothetical protein Droror1_Dr00025180 [Drosera rotundifolia]
MQRWSASSKLRSLSATLRAAAATAPLSPPPPPLRRLLHSSPLSSTLKPSPFSLPRHDSSKSPHFPHLGLQVRSFSAKSREKKWKKTTPATSKVKKIKIKGYSSFKGRFRTMNDGTIRRWREGKRHNAHLKSKKAKRRLRKPSIVPLAYAKVMKKLNFCG